MATVDESKIPPPVSPVTLWLNLKALDFTFAWFMRKYLPAFTARITSEYRSAEHNKEVGGAANSAHVHGLARDFNLQLNGVDVPKEQEMKLFTDFIKPNWPGYSLFEVDHIHVNLSREITTIAGAAGVAAVGVVGYQVLKSMGGGTNG